MDAGSSQGTAAADGWGNTGWLIATISRVTFLEVYAKGRALITAGPHFLVKHCRHSSFL